MINTEFIVNEWLPALRSGDYAQTTDNLHSSEGYCCLGVACQLLVGKGILEYSENTVRYYAKGNRTDHHMAELPVAAMEYIGIQSLGELGTEDNEDYYGLESLAAINDSEKANFNQIADIIELALENGDLMPYDEPYDEEDYDDEEE